MEDSFLSLVKKKTSSESLASLRPGRKGTIQSRWLYLSVMGEAVHGHVGLPLELGHW